MHTSNRMFRNDKEVHARVPDAFELATDQERRKMFLRYVNRGWLILGIVTLATLPFFPHLRREFTFLIAVTFPTYLIIRFLNLSGKTRLAGIVFTLIVNFGFYGVFLVLIDELGPYQAFDTQATVWMLMGLAVLFAGAFVDKWAAPVVALFNTILLVATRLTLAPGSYPRPSVIVFWWMLALTIWLYERTLSRALERAWTELAERRKAEMELQESRNFLQQVVDTSPSMIFVVDGMGKAVFVNRYTAQYYGTTPEQMIAKSTQDVHQPEKEAAEFVGDDQEVIRTRKGIVKEELNTAPNGEQHWFHTVKVPLLRSDGTVGALGISIDITQRKQAEEALQESEQNLKHAQRIAHVGHWTWDIQTNRVALSDEMYCILGLDRESFNGDINEIIRRTTHPEDIDRVVSTLGQTTQGQNPVGIEYRIVRPDGAIRHIWAEPGDRVTHASGKILKLSGIVQDITARKQAEQALRASDARFRAVVERSFEAVSFVGLDGKAFYTSPSTERTIGYTPEERIGRDGFQDVHPDEVEAVAGKFGELVRNPGGTLSVQARMRHKDGSWQWIEAVAQNLLADPDIGAIVINSRNITERKQAEEALRNSQAQVTGIFNSAMDAIISTDADQRILIFNPAAEAMFRCSQSEAIGQPLERFIPQRFRVTHSYHVQNFVQSGTTSRKMDHLGIIYGLRSDGDEFPIEASISKIHAAGHNLYTVILRDITERKRAERKIQCQLQRLSSLRAIDVAISSSFDVRVTLDIVLQHVVSQLGVDAAAILLVNPHTQTIEYAGSRGFRSNALHHTQLKLSEGYAGRAVRERLMIHIPDLLQTGSKLVEAMQLAKEDFVDYYGTPLIVKGEIKGVLEIYHRSALNSDPEWLEFLETLAGQAAIAIDNAKLLEGLQRSTAELIFAYDATIEGWSLAMDLRDKETEGHTLRVTELTLSMARSMGLKEEEIIHIRRGGLLHDIGKLGVPDNILLKHENLTDVEWEIMRKHPTYAYEMLSSITYLEPALDIPYCHHEKWDGTGYPRGLKGEQIPLVARIFAIVDVWDALTSDRPYRSAWTKEETLKYIKKQSGKYFDPQVVDAFLRLIANGQMHA